MQIESGGSGDSSSRIEFSWWQSNWQCRSLISKVSDGRSLSVACFTREGHKVVDETAQQTSMDGMG